MKNILVALDFKGNEQLLIDTAHDFSEAFQAKIWLVHITAPNPDYVGYEAGPQYIRDHRATELKKEHKLLETYSNKLNAKGIESEGLLVQGATIEMIIKESNKLNIDLIIIGHEEHDFIYKALFGSVSRNIIKKSKIPVLIIPIE
jgi:nucleotide-binding universal stress UspA family protein